MNISWYVASSFVSEAKAGIFLFPQWALFNEQLMKIRSNVKINGSKNCTKVFFNLFPFAALKY